MSSNRRRRSRDSAARDDAGRVFVEEYRFLRGGNMSHQAIARHLGISLDTLQARLLRYDCVILSAAEERIADRLDDLITRGDPFTLEQVTALDDGTALILVNIAVERGRLRSGKPGGIRRSATIYTPIGEGAS
ncbi:MULTISPECIES: hypothetical protein [unclassified Nocardia]|uniref:hypothetical protein n=1 Tax=unclassified Nocardia TaxID=2637762 RepID=UPI001CE47B63|nr:MULTISPECIES: hypothetical protein [unclassified Nocardia]